MCGRCGGGVNRRQFVRLLALAGLALGSAAGWPSAVGRLQGPTAHLTGQVRDRRSGIPLPWVIVRASPWGGLATTDRAGRYSLALPPGTYTLTVMAAGYQRLTLPAVELAEGQVLSLDLALDPAPQRTGQVPEQLPPDLIPPPPLPGPTIAAALPPTIRVRLPDGRLQELPLEEYVKGVVPSEMPATWPLEALKAQAVAARSYAVAYVQRYGEICTTESCQVYDPDKRTAQSDRAVDETRGIVLTFNDQVVLAYYSSTCGGHTDMWSSAPWTRWVRDDGTGENTDLSSEAAARTFYTGQPPSFSFCQPSPRYRWTVRWERAQLEAVIAYWLADYAATAPGAVSPAFAAGTPLGELREVRIVRRQPSGTVAEFEIATTQGTWRVASPSGTGLRWVLRPWPASGNVADALLLNSAKVVVDLQRDQSGRLVAVQALGGGWGHGAGLCQWGAKGMAEQGWAFDRILRYYYQGITLTPLSPVRYPRVLFVPRLYQRGVDRP